MASIILSQSTQDKINLAIAAGPGANNQNYFAAYTAVSNELSASGGFNSGTVNWFSQAGEINSQAFRPSASGTYIWNYTTAAAKAQGTTITTGDLQTASNKIGRTVFEQLKDSNFVFSDNAFDRINFAPKTIVQIDAGAGLGTLSDLHPGSNLTYAIWGGTLFARTQLNDPTYLTDNNINLTPGSADCAAITAGSVGAVNAVFSSILSIAWSQGPINFYNGAIAAIGSQDNAIIKACFPGQQGSFGSGSSKLTLDGNSILSFGEANTGAGVLQVNFDGQGRTVGFNTSNNDGTSTKTVFDTGTEAWTSDASAFDAHQRLISKRVVFDSGNKQVKQYDPNNTHPYDELDISEDSTGKPTAVQMKIDGQNVTAAAASVGQVLGSALGRALAPNNQFGQIAIGTVAGAIGQQLAQTFAASLLTDASKISLAGAFTDFHISIAGAGAGAVASFLTAELGHALGLSGFNEQMFNATVGTLASGVANRIAADMAAQLTFDGAIGAINWGGAVLGAVNNIEPNIASIFGAYLGRELVPAQTHEGAVGGQLLGAVGSAIGIVLGNVLGGVLNFIIPGIGSLIGTIVGTLIGDKLGAHPHPAAVDTIDPAGDHYGYTHSSVAEGGTYDAPDKMAAAAVNIINGYLNAVNGAAIDHGKQTMVGYVTDPDFRYINGWTPSHEYFSFVSPDDAVHRAALDILQHTEVIGGNLLLKRAHHNSPSSIPDPDPEWAGLTTPSSESRAEKLVSMSGDLSVAQDYENYLNNREAINALMAANPDSAFTAGWIATFARVNDLKLNQMGASDFLGGLVGYLDSVNKAGLGAEAANVSVKLLATGGIGFEVRAANSAEVPGALSVFADRTDVSSDSGGQSVTFVFGGGLGPLDFYRQDTNAPGGDGHNDFWIGGDAGATFIGTGGHDILVGGTMNDVIFGGAGWDFIDGGAGNDYLFGQDGNDILRGGRGTDFLFGDQGDDTYVFNRGDGADTVLDDVTLTTTTSGWHDWYEDQDGVNIFHHDPVTTTTTSHPNAGADRLVFGPGIAVSDIAVQISAGGQNLIVGVRDPAHPGVPFGQLADTVTLRNWNDPYDRVDTFVFADGTTLNTGTGLGPYLVPFGETLSHNRVAENSAIGTVVGTVAAYDLEAGAILSYSLTGDVTGGRFAINASTGAITVAGSLNFEGTSAWPVTVRAADQYGHVFDKAFTINVTDVNERPTGITLSGGSAPENSPGGTIFGTAHGIDPDAGAVLSYSLADNAGGRFFIYSGSGIIVNNSSQTIDYEASHSYAITVRATDQSGLSFEKTIGIALANVNDNAPVLTAAANIAAGPSQTLAASSLFSAGDADGDALTTFIYDWSAAANSGHFVVNGAIVPAQTVIGLTPSDLAHTTFVAGALGTTDDLGVMAFDGVRYSGNTSFSPIHVTAVNHAPVINVPQLNVAAGAGQVFAAASLFTASDADGDALTTFIYDWSPAASSGHFVVNGAVVAAQTVIGLTASDLAHTSFVAGAAGSVDDLGVMAFDGHDYSGNTSFNGFHVLV